MSNTNVSSHKSPESQVPEEKSRIETRFFTITIILTAILFSAVGAVTYWNISRKQDNNAKPSSETNCIYNNATYDDGDTFQSTDGCNTCTCQGGKVACTEMACIDETEENSINTYSPNFDKSYKSKLLDLEFSYDSESFLVQKTNYQISNDTTALNSITISPKTSLDTSNNRVTTNIIDIRSSENAPHKITEKLKVTMQESSQQSPVSIQLDGKKYTAEKFQRGEGMVSEHNENCMNISSKTTYFFDIKSDYAILITETSETTCNEDGTTSTFENEETYFNSTIKTIESIEFTQSQIQ